MREKLIELLIDGLGESEVLTHMYGEPMERIFRNLPIVMKRKKCLKGARNDENQTIILPS